MGQEIAIKTESLASDITLMQSRLNAIKNDMGKMFEAVAILDRMWEGPANQVFVQQFTTDQQSMEQLCDVIQSIINCLTYAKDEYTKCENEVNSIVSSIRI